MTPPEPAAVLRHRGPALRLGTVERFDGRSLECAGRHDGAWRWPDLLEAGAQAAGLLAGLQDGLSNRAVIAEYRGVRIHAALHVGPVRVTARLDRRLLHFRRCRVEARDASGHLLLEALVSLAPGTNA